MTMTMEQQRAADAWACSEGCTRAYVTLAKGLPALIMNSGLMQTMAFLEDKGYEQHKALGKHLRQWLARHYNQTVRSSDYEDFMEGLFQAEPQQFQEVTAEAMAWLRWVRQIAPTQVDRGGD